MEVLPGPTTAQGVARTKQSEKVETHGGAEGTGGTEAHVKQPEKVETHGGAEGTGGTEAHVKQPGKGWNTRGCWRYRRYWSTCDRSSNSWSSEHRCGQVGPQISVPDHPQSVSKLSSRWAQEESFLSKTSDLWRHPCLWPKCLPRRFHSAGLSLIRLARNLTYGRIFWWNLDGPKERAGKRDFESTAKIHDGCFVQSRIPATGGRPFDHLHPLHHGGTMQKLLPDTPVRWVPCESEAKRWCDPRKEVRHTWTGSQMDWASDGSRGQGGID